jgi:NAD(P)-dependent dehydrogenase (short-subunit alcohol dehydrogenase family)
VLATEYRDDAIRANAVLPSVIDTPANRRSMPDADHERWVAPAQIAAVVRFLCEDGSGVISGAHVPVYGRA